MLSVIVAILLIISLVLCVKGISVCAKASVWEPIMDYLFIFISISLAIVLIGYLYFNVCVEIIL